MRAWTTSACVALAWTLLLAALAAAGLTGSARPAQANTRTASNTKIIFTSIQRAAQPAAPPPRRPWRHPRHPPPRRPWRPWRHRRRLPRRP